MKNIIIIVLGAFVFLSFQPIALGADPPKFGVVDLKRFQQKSKAFQKTSASMRKKFESMQKRLDEEQSALKKIEEEFKKQSMILSLDAQEDKKRELDRKKRYVKYLFDDFTLEAKNIERETIKRILKEIETILNKLGKERAYTLIFDKRTAGLIFSSAAIDITDNVIEIYDNQKR